MEPHDNSPEDMGPVQCFFLDSTPINPRKLQSLRGRRRHAPRKHGARCGCRVAGSPAAEKSHDVEYDSN